MIQQNTFQNRPLPSPHQNLSDPELLKQTALSARAERTASLTLLQYLSEVERRKLYAAAHFSSLHQYLVEALGFSEFQASERVNTVRLMNVVPEVKEHLASGKLNLTTASQIQRFVWSEQKLAKLQEDSKSPTFSFNAHTAKDLAAPTVKACLNQPKREVEKILFALASAPVQVAMKERLARVSHNRVELKITFDSTIEKKLKRARELVRAQTLVQVFEKSLDALIEREEKKLGKVIVRDQKVQKPQQVTRPPQTSNQIHSRYIPVEFKQIIFQRSQGQCEFVNAASGLRCPSKSHLEIDHVRPLARDGTTTPENLRYLCRNHNVRAGIEWGVMRAV